MSKQAEKVEDKQESWELGLLMLFAKDRVVFHEKDTPSKVIQLIKSLLEAEKKKAVEEAFDIEKRIDDLKKTVVDMIKRHNKEHEELKSKV